MKIALLTTPFLEEFYNRTLEEAPPPCETKVYVYQTYEHVAKLYGRLKEQYDGVIAGGTAPMSIIEGAFPEHGPIEHIRCSASNFYREFFRAAYEYQDFKFQYGYFDFCDYLCPDGENSMTEWLREGRLEEWLEKNNEYMENMGPEQMYRSLEESREKHIALWNSKKIRYSLSRRSLIVPEVTAAGVNCRFIYCSSQDVQDAFDRLIREIRIRRLEDIRPSVVYIFREPRERKEREALLKAVRAFEKKNLLNFEMEPCQNGLKIYTSYDTVRSITDHFTSCLLRQFLRERGIGEAFIGYGLGNDFQQASANAADAARESQLSPEQNSFLIDEERNKIGLFGRGEALVLPEEAPAHVRELADLTGLSSLTVQKLFAACRIIGTENVTSADLARVLHITVRSANRILDTLIRSQMAELMYSRQAGTKGRPRRVYRLLMKI